MITISKKRTKYANNYYEFVADTEDDLLTAEETTTTLLKGKRAGIHSNIFVINSGKTYYRDSEGNWIEAAYVPPTFAEVTLSELKANVLSGKALKLYNVGDTRTIVLKNGQAVTLRIANNTSNLYSRTDGTTTGFVLEFVNCYNTTYYMNASADNTGGWNASYMRTTVMNEILAQMPDDWQEIIATVKTKAGNGYSTSNVVIESEDKLFLPAEREVFATRSDSSQIEWNALTLWQYYEQHTETADRIKSINGTSSYWWLRSASGYYMYGFCDVDYNGTNSAYSASEKAGVSPAFCL